ncbi:MAG: type II toxin-antitoxin system Phd/YefM family antitoxin [Ignavibacteriaceae bacterium]
MNTIPVSELRSNLMKVLKEIEHGSIFKITSRGKIVAKLVPPGNSRDEAKNKLKAISKSAVIGDILSPIDSKWEALDNDNC